jgi:hypothetical protein
MPVIGQGAAGCRSDPAARRSTRPRDAGMDLDSLRRCQLRESTRSGVHRPDPAPDVEPEMPASARAGLWSGQRYVPVFAKARSRSSHRAIETSTDRPQPWFHVKEERAFARSQQARLTAGARSTRRRQRAPRRRVLAQPGRPRRSASASGARLDEQSAHQCSTGRVIPIA